MPYRFLEDEAIADVAFEARGATLSALLSAAALATTNVMVKDLKQVKRRVTKKIATKADSIEMLLFNFLQEIIYYKDAELLLFNSYAVKTKKEKKGFSLVCTARGERLDMKKHELMVDVKAVTLHQFEVKRVARGWKAHVILDI